MNRIKMSQLEYRMELLKEFERHHPQTETARLMILALQASVWPSTSIIEAKKLIREAERQAKILGI